MKAHCTKNGFCIYTDGDSAPDGALAFARLGVTKDRHAVSLVADGIAFVAGIGYTHHAVAHLSLPRHIHPDCIELHYCLNGAINFEIDGEFHTLLPGAVCVTQPNVRHHLVSNAKGHRHYWLLLKLPSASEVADAFGLPPAEARELRRRLAAINRPVFQVDGEMKSLFGEVFKTLESMPRGTYRTLLLRTAVVRILTLLVRDAERRDFGRHTSQTIDQLVESIRQNPEEHRTVSEMARASGRCESKFNADFKRATGFPPAAFIANCRIQKGIRMLETTRMSISAIADQLGYSSAAHFSSRFRLFCDMTPRGFRMKAAAAQRDE